ncbi:MAG: tetratricopeptide repeat protein, partial [Candidatus Sericytochromatia bacterium]
PKFIKTYINRGWTYAVLKQYDKAIADYTTALEYDPNYAYAYNNRGLAYHHLKQFDKKIADFKKACQLGIAETCKWLKDNGH